MSATASAARAATAHRAAPRNAPVAPVSLPMPERFRSLEEFRSYILRAAYASDRSLWEFVSEIANDSFTLYAEWNPPRGLTIPFQVSVSYADGMITYTPIDHGTPAFARYITEYFIPRVHPR